MKTLLKLSSVLLLVAIVILHQQCQPATGETSDDKTENATASTTEKDVDEIREVKPIEASPELEEKPIEPVVSNEELDLRTRLVTHASTFLNKGIKYDKSGTNQNGFDCSGFTSHIFNEFDISIAGSSAMLSELGKAIELENAKTGDLMFFIRPEDESKRVFHVGIIEKNEKDENGKLVTTIIHSKTGDGPSRDEIQKAHWWRDLTFFARDILSD